MKRILSIFLVLISLCALPATALAADSMTVSLN